MIKLKGIKAAPVNVSTDWNSRMIITIKSSGDICICIDPRPLSKVLKYKRYQLPMLTNVKKVLHQVRRGIYYWHVALDNEFSYLTTFQTGFGQYWWLWHSFGAFVSSEIFQKCLPHFWRPEWNCICCWWHYCFWFKRQTRANISRPWFKPEIATAMMPQEENQTEQRKSSTERIGNQLHGAPCNSWWLTTRPS